LVFNWAKVAYDEVACAVLFSFCYKVILAIRNNYLLQMRTCRHVPVGMFTEYTGS